MEENQNNVESTQQMQQPTHNFFHNVVSVDETRVSLLMICLVASLLFGAYMYVANADINLRADASADATWIAGVTSGTQLTSTGVCDNGWIEVSYEGQTAYVSGDYVSAVAADGAAADGTADQAATEGSADAAADEAVAG